MKNIFVLMLVVVVLSIFTTAIGCQFGSHAKHGADAVFTEVFNTCYAQVGGFIMLWAIAYMNGHRIQVVEKQ